MSINKDAAAQIARLMHHLVDHGLLAGYNTAIVTPDDAVTEAYGYRQTVPVKEPTDTGTRYDLASLSKVVSTTTCLLKLREQGLIDLDTTIHSVVPEVANEAITVKDCMTHTTGLIPDIPGYKQMSDEEFYRAIFTQQPEADFIGKVRYSDINYIWLGLMISRLKGSLDGYAHDAVFAPLGMNDTGYCPPDASRCAATEVTAERGVIRGTVHDGKAYRLGGVGGSAGVFSTIGDLTRFVRMMMDDRDPFLSEETRGLLKLCWTPEDGVRRTLGWILSSRDAGMGLEYSPHTLYHTGFTGGSILIDLDRKLSFIILCNRVHPSRDNDSILLFRNTLNSIVYDCLKED